MESETVREWPASTDQRGGSRGLTANARAVWMSPPALSNIVLAEITMGSMAALPSGLIWAGTLENSGLEAKALRLSTASSRGAVAARHWARFSSVKSPSSA